MLQTSYLTFPHLPTSVGAEREICIIRIQFHITRSSHSHIQSVRCQASQRGHGHDRRSHRPTAEVKGLRRCAPKAKGCCDHRAGIFFLENGKHSVMPTFFLVITLPPYTLPTFLLRAIFSQNSTGTTWSSLKVEKEGFSRGKILWMRSETGLLRKQGPKAGAG